MLRASGAARATAGFYLTVQAESAPMFRRLAPLLKIFAATLLLLIAIDAALFRSGAYNDVVKLNSTAGSVIGDTLAIERYYEAGRKNILVLGNSQIGEGFSAPIADAQIGDSNVHFVNGSVAGTTPRVWDYLLREIDPEANRFAAVALMVDYDEARNRNNFTDYSLDISYLSPLLRLRDIETFPQSFADNALRERARRAIVMPIQALHEDVQDLLLHPLQRISDVSESRPTWLAAVGVYGGQDGALPPLEIDSSTGTAKSWGDYEAEWKPQLESYFRELRRTASPALQEENDRYQRFWVGRIADRYRANGIPVIVFNMARGPWKAELLPVPTLNPALTELRDTGKIVALRGDAFTELEKPELFMDTQHLNRTGRERFSKLFAAQVAPLIR